MLATVVGVIVVRQFHDDPGWPVVAAVGGALLGGEVVSLVA